MTDGEYRIAIIKAKLLKKLRLNAQRWIAQKPLCGIYFLLLDDAIVYIGKSIDIRSRVDEHVRQGVRPFNRVAIIECPEERLTELENFYISLLKDEGLRNRTKHGALKPSHLRTPAERFSQEHMPIGLLPASPLVPSIPWMKPGFFVNGCVLQPPRRIADVIDIEDGRRQ